MAMTVVFSLGFFYECVLHVYSVQIFGFIYPAEWLGSAVGQISPAAAQTTAEWTNRPGIIEYRLITTLYLVHVHVCACIIIISMWGLHLKEGRHA